MRDMKYLNQKRVIILDTIKPICEAYGITNYDYEIKETGQSEILVINGTRIGCSSNSINAVIQELTGYIFLMKWRDRYLGAFETQTCNVIRRYWIKEDGE